MTVRKSVPGSIRRALLALLGVAAAFPAQAVMESDSTTGRVNAEITTPVAVTEATDMSFGWMAQPASPGTALLTPANRIVSSGLALMTIDGASSAKIVISGTPNQTVGLLIDDIANFGNGARTISVSSFTHDGGTSPALGPDGKATIDLGATLRLSANTQNGRYRGAFDVIVSNN
jgi:hypothetical protein